MSYLTIEVDCTNEDNPVYRVQEFRCLAPANCTWITIETFKTLKEAEAFKLENEN